MSFIITNSRQLVLYSPHCHSNNPLLLYAHPHSGFRTKGANEDDTRGGYIFEDTCYAINFAPSSGVYAIARCCDFSQYAFSCDTYQSDLSAYTNGAKAYETCPAGTTLLGWYVIIL